MKRFSFRLESVLSYRKFREKKAMLQLIKFRNTHVRIKNKILELKNEKLKVSEKCRTDSSQGIDASLYKSYISYLDKLGVEIKNSKVELDENETAMKQQEAVLKSETINKKALEIHKETLFKAHSIAAEKEEQKLLDEMILIRQGVKV